MEAATISTITTMETKATALRSESNPPRLVLVAAASAASGGCSRSSSAILRTISILGVVGRIGAEIGVL
jgi:hypothetical protein